MQPSSSFDSTYNTVPRCKGLTRDGTRCAIFVNRGHCRCHPPERNYLSPIQSSEYGSSPSSASTRLEQSTSAIVREVTVACIYTKGKAKGRSKWQEGYLGYCPAKGWPQICRLLDGDGGSVTDIQLEGLPRELEMDADAGYCIQLSDAIADEDSETDGFDSSVPLRIPTGRPSSKRPRIPLPETQRISQIQRSPVTSPRRIQTRSLRRDCRKDSVPIELLWSNMDSIQNLARGKMSYWADKENEAASIEKKRGLARLHEEEGRRSLIRAQRLTEHANHQEERLRQDLCVHDMGISDVDGQLTSAQSGCRENSQRD